MKMRAIKGKKMGEMVMPEKDAISYPSLYLPTSAIPEAKKWEVGDSYEVVLHVRMTGMHQRRGGDGSVEFDITSVGVGGDVESPKEKKARRYAREEE